MSANFRRAFWAVASLIKLLLAEWIAVICLAQIYGVVSQGFGRGPCAGDWGLLGIFTLLGFLIGGAALAWWLWRTLWPTTLDEEYVGRVKLGSLVLANRRFGTSRYAFLSTHPAYLVVDAVTLASAWFLYRFSDLDLANDGCVYVVDLARGEAALGIALCFPIVRLVGWYLLKRRVVAPLSAGLYPAIWFVIVWSLPMLIALYAWWRVWVLPQQAAPLLDRRPADPAPTEVVRLVGHLRTGSLQHCPCPAGYDAACKRVSVVVELVDQTVVLLTAEGLGRRDLEQLAAEAAEPFETFGRLLPRDQAVCGFGAARPDLVMVYELP